MARYHGKSTVVYVDGYDLSGDSNQFDVTAQADVAEVTAFTDARKQYVVGHEMGQVSHRAWFNDEANRSHLILSQRAGSAALLLAAAWGTAQGSKGVAGSATLENTYNVNAPIGGGIGITANYMSSGPTGFEYVDTLQPKANLAGTTTPKDDLAATANGLRAYMQLFSALAGTPSHVLYHGTAMAGPWAAIGTFTGSTAPVAEAIAVGGNINRFIMGSAVGGSANVWLAYRRL